MSSWNKDNTVFIQASTGFLYQGCNGEGFRTYHPYIGRGWIMRITREICFRIPFLPETVWFNKAFLNDDIRYIVVWDPLVTRDYLLWLKKNFPNAQINFKYTNMVGRTKHLFPDSIPKGIRKWTFDAYDSQKYGMRLQDSHSYFKMFIKPKKETKYDVFFIGKDKGRGEYILDLERQLKNLGLKTKFIITKDGKLSKSKSYYQKELPYSKVVDYLVQSKAVLNVVMENQQGITLRDIEATILGLKLITTNTHIKKADFYLRDNIFILNEQNISDLPHFLNSEIVSVNQDILKKYTLDNFVDEITSD